LRELHSDLRNGLVSQEQFEQDRDEIERRLLEDVSETRPASKRQHASRSLAYAMAMGLPAMAILLYLKVGNQNALSASTASVTQQSGVSSPFANQSGQMSQQQIEANVAALAKRLEQSGDDAQGWITLARSYSSLERYSEAVAAFEKATALVNSDPELWADYAYAAAMANGRSMQGKPIEFANRALKLDPENQKALILAGNAAFEAKNYNQAIDYWEKLLRKVPAGSEVSQSLAERINEAKRLANSGAAR
jgi:cytochrome c-type biogenesis protein CcmH